MIEPLGGDSRPLGGSESAHAVIDPDDLLPAVDDRHTGGRRRLRCRGAPCAKALTVRIQHRRPTPADVNAQPFWCMATLPGECDERAPGPGTTEGPLQNVHPSVSVTPTSFFSVLEAGGRLSYQSYRLPAM